MSAAKCIMVENMTHIVLSGDIRIHFVANMKPMSTEITLLTQSGRLIKLLGLFFVIIK